MKNTSKIKNIVLFSLGFVISTLIINTLQLIPINEITPFVACIKNALSVMLAIGVALSVFFAFFVLWLIIQKKLNLVLKKYNLVLLSKIVYIVITGIGVIYFTVSILSIFDRLDSKYLSSKMARGVFGNTIGHELMLSDTSERVYYKMMMGDRLYYEKGSTILYCGLENYKKCVQDTVEYKFINQDVYIEYNL